MTLFLDAGRNSLGVSMGIEIDFVWVWVVDIDLRLVWGIEVDFLSV